MNATGDVEAIVGDFGWFPENFDAAQKTLWFVHTNRAEIEQQSFLDPRWHPQEGLRRQLPMQAVIAASAKAQAPHLNFIWHTSYCCSTLLARAIDRPGFNLSLREPLILVSLANAWREGAFSTGTLPASLPETIFRLLARRDSARSQVTVKPSNFANVLAREAARLTRGKALFLYSDLPDLLVSILKGGVRLQRYARQLFGKISGDGEQALPWSASDLVRMSDLEIAALAWHLQIAEFRRCLPALGPARAASLDCAALLADPATLLRRLDEFFDFDFGTEYLHSVATGGLFERDAKFPERPFSAAARKDKAQSLDPRSAGDIARVAEWSYRVFPGTPRGAPLPNALV